MPIKTEVKPYLEVIMGLIYKITNTINNKVYIGQTIYDLQHRFNAHKSEARTRKDNYPLHNAMRKYGDNNFIIELIEDNIPNELLNELEQYYIKKYNSYINAPNSCGYNATLGGDGGKTLLFDVKTLDLIIQFYNNCNSIEATANHFNYNWITIKRILDDNNIVIKAQHGGNNKKEIYQIDKDTNIIINKFNSIADALDYLGKNRTMTTGISEVCKGKRITAYGYKWKYVI